MLLLLIVIMGVCTVVHRATTVVDSFLHINNNNIKCLQVMLPDVSSYNEDKEGNSGQFDHFDVKNKVEPLPAEADLNSIDRAEEFKTHVSATATRLPGNVRSHIFGNAHILSNFPGQEDLQRGSESRRGMKDSVVRFRKLADRLSGLLHDPDGKMGNIQNAALALWSNGVCDVVENRVRWFFVQREQAFRCLERIVKNHPDCVQLVKNAKARAKTEAEEIEAAEAADSLGRTMTRWAKLLELDILDIRNRSVGKDNLLIGPNLQPVGRFGQESGINTESKFSVEEQAMFTNTGLESLLPSGSDDTFVQGKRGSGDFPTPKFDAGDDSEIKEQPSDVESSEDVWNILNDDGEPLSVQQRMAVDHLQQELADARKAVSTERAKRDDRRKTITTVGTLPNRLDELGNDDARVEFISTMSNKIDPFIQLHSLVLSTLSKTAPSAYVLLLDPHKLWKEIM